MYLKLRTKDEVGIAVNPNDNFLYFSEHIKFQCNNH